MNASEELMEEKSEAAVPTPGREVVGKELEVSCD
jgi:hypothetical protein